MSTDPPDAAPRPAAAAPAPGRPAFWLTRAFFLRGLGGVYLVAFLALALQLRPLVGSHGLLPARDFLDRVASQAEGGSSAFWQLPGIFWIDASDGFMTACAWIGVALSVVVAAGFANAILLALLWLVYLSFVHVGQLFYSFGWEILLLETGFLAIFMAPLVRGSAFAPSAPPPWPLILCLRWLTFRVMLGAGLIKIRGDGCWRDLTCLVYHYETQPLPNPLSWLLHQAPPWFHRLELLWNHFVELVVPWFLFGPRRVRTIAGALTVAFQATLILSGNLSWLNYLTILIAIGCFDDRALARLLPRRLLARLPAPPDPPPAPPLGQKVVVGAFSVLVAVLSVRPALNLLDPHQHMNDSFDPLHLVNTYGAFGSIGRGRDEIVIEGTADDPASPAARWVEYEWKCKPGDVRRRPCVVAPYQLRVDWEVWFAAMSDHRQHPWLVHLVWKLLHGDHGALSLLAPGPWSEGLAPRAIRATLYDYRFTRWGDGSGAWWVRDRVREWLPPLTRDDPQLRRFLAANGFRVEE